MVSERYGRELGVGNKIYLSFLFLSSTFVSNEVRAIAKSWLMKKQLVSLLSLSLVQSRDGFDRGVPKKRRKRVVAFLVVSEVSEGIFVLRKSFHLQFNIQYDYLHK